MADTAQEKRYVTYGEMNLINRMRRLWMELAMWRRAYLISSAANFGDLPLVGVRLYNIPAEFKDIFETFFGEETAEEFQDKITEQMLIINEILNAIKTNDTKTVDQSTMKLYANADDLSAFLAKINPYWNEQTWRNFWYEYYKTIILEMVMILSGRYAEAISLNEGLVDQALKIADYMADGFIQYFIR